MVGDTIPHPVVLLIKQARLKKRVSAERASRRAGWSIKRWGQIEKASDVQLSTLERMARTLGYRLVITLEKEE